MIAPRRVGQLLLSGMLVLASAGAGQDEDESRQHGIFLDTVDVSLINLEVTVSRNGEPVTDLTARDFALTDDGEPIEITHFYAVRDGRRLAAAAPGETAPDETLAAVPERAAIVVLVDNAFIGPASRKKVFTALYGQLESLMAGGTQVMVVEKDFDIRVRQRFTTDRSEVEAALAQLEKTAGTSALHDMGTQAVIREIDRGAPPNEDTGSVFGSDLGEYDAVATYNRARSHSHEVYQSVRRSVLVLKHFMGSLSGLPGRKAVLYVADRMPLTPGRLVFAAWFAKYETFASVVGTSSVEHAVRDFDATPELNELVADASASRVAFYPVGFSSGPIQMALSAANPSYVATPTVALGSESAESDGLYFLAHGTGGEAAVRLGKPELIFDRVREDLSHYYSLGYPSPHRGDGKSHRVKLEVRRPGVRVRYLETYRDKSNDQQMNDRTLAALLLEAGDNPLGVRLEVGQTQRGKDGGFLVPLAVRFPISNLVLVPEEEVHVGSVSIFVVVRDAKGRMSDPAKIDVPIRIPNKGMLQAMSQTAHYATKLAMRSGDQKIAVGVRDDFGSTSSTVNVNVQVGGGSG